MYTQRLQDRLSALVKYIEDSHLNQSIKSSDFVISKKESLLVYNRY